MWESSSLHRMSGSAYTGSRDLNTMFEENENELSKPDTMMTFSSQALDPALHDNLGFLRLPHSKTPVNSTSLFHNQQTPSTTLPQPTMPTMRRSRAGTMPSFVNLPEEDLCLPRPSLVVPPTVPHRHRSGSLNMPAMQLSFDNPSFLTPWNPLSQGTVAEMGQHRIQPLASPSTEQFLQNDHESSIAHTLRSIGLDDDSQVMEAHENSRSLYQQQMTPEFQMSNRNLMSSSRNRSYSVNATAQYQSEVPPSVDQSRSSTIPLSKGFASPLEGFTRKQTRPRASSMGRMEAPRFNVSSMGRMEAPRFNVSSMWSLQRTSLTTLRDEEFLVDVNEVNEELLLEQNNAMSMGDNELLTKIFQHQTLAEAKRLESNELNASRIHAMREFGASTPPFQERNLMASMASNPLTQVPTRSLWVGNIDASVTVEMLTQMFNTFGPIESIRLLLEKECAFINYFNIENAVQAKQYVLERMGGRVGSCVARIGYGKVDGAVPESNTLQPTRALWLGNIPSSTTSSALQRIFSSFGVIESIRVLPHKSCGFINFESVANASAAKDALLHNKLAAQGFMGIRVGFAKVPPAKTPQNETSGVPVQRSTEGEAEASDNEIWVTELSEVMRDYGVCDKLIEDLKALKGPSGYFTSIPPVPELYSNRVFDGTRLREMRKKLDAAASGGKEVEAIALECMDEVAELSSDYIGNTVVQRLFEKSEEDIKTFMLVRIAPHLAAISVHKNGTWAAQKIIETAKTPAQIRLISDHLKPYAPPLLLDQFGNYAVQCCLRLGEGDNQFIFDAIAEKLLQIAQGRFGARAIRGTLESQYATLDQQKYVAAVFTQNAPALATNANGVLLLSWLIESSKIEKRMSLIASRFSSHMQTLCIHKLGSQMVLKLVNQDQDPNAQDILMSTLLTKQGLLAEIIADPTRGLGFIQKILSSTYIPSDQLQTLKTKVLEELNTLNGPTYKKLLEELTEPKVSESNKQ